MIYIIDHQDSFTWNVVHQFSEFDEVYCSNYFDINKWQINQPIIMKDLSILLDKVEGVQTVQNIVIKNKTGNSIGYSDYAYDVKGATINNVVYPSIDPMIFELKYPNTDIQGRVVPL